MPRLFRFSPRIALLFAAFAAAPTFNPVFAAPKRAAVVDEFAPVPLNSPIHAHLKTVSGAGWTTRPWNADAQATRSEAALEVARVIFTVSARARTDASWTATASKPAARALRALISALKPELAQLGVQTREPLDVVRLIERAKPSAPIAAKTPEVAPREPSVRPSRLRLGGEVRPAPSDAPFLNSPLEGAPERLRRPPAPLASALRVPFSQRLRVETAALSLAEGSATRFDRRADARFHANPTSRASRVQTGAALDLGNLTFRADYDAQRRLKPAFGLRDELLDSADRQSSVGGGVDVNALGVTFSGDVARLRTPNIDGNGVKVGGGVRVSAWQNRLTLAANLSRLLPEDANALASSAAQLNVGLEVSQSVTLNLLYQQLFSAASQQRTERFVGGGISVNF